MMRLCKTLLFLLTPFFLQPLPVFAQEKIELSMEAQIDHQGIFALRLALLPGEKNASGAWRMYDLRWKPGSAVELPHRFDPQKIISKSSEKISVEVSSLLGESPGSLLPRLTEFFINSVNSACSQAPLPTFCTQMEPMTRSNFEQYMRSYLTTIAGSDPIVKECLRLAKRVGSAMVVCLDIKEIWDAGTAIGDYPIDHPQNFHRYTIRRLAASLLFGSLDPGGNFIGPWEDEEPACWCVYHWRDSVGLGRADKQCRTLHMAINRCGGPKCHCEIPDDEKCPPEEPGKSFNTYPKQEVVEKVECGAACYSLPHADQLRKCGESDRQGEYTCCTKNRECYTQDGKPKCGPYCPQAFFQCGSTCCEKNEFCDREVADDPITWRCKPAVPAPRPPGLELRYDIAE
jgi:hypothetical protein